MADGLVATLVPKNKVVAATGGAAVGAAVSVILVYILQSIGTKAGFALPETVVDAFSTIFTAMVTLAAGYYTPPGANEGSKVEVSGSVKSALI